MHQSWVHWSDGPGFGVFTFSNELEVGCYAMREAFSKMAAPLQPAISKAGKMNTSQANATDQNKQVTICKLDDFSGKR